MEHSVGPPSARTQSFLRKRVAVKYTIEQLREIVELVKHKCYDELEEKWLEMAESPTSQIRFYDSMARALLKNDERGRLAELFSLMASSLVAKGRAAEAVAVIRTAWRHAPDLGSLSETAIEALKALYGRRPHFKSFISAGGLDQRADLFRALERFEEFLYCDVGEVFEHQALGIGIVEEIAPDRRRVTIRFPGKAPKEFTCEGVRDFLKKHKAGGFRAEQLRDPEALKRRAFESPAEFVRFVLKDHPEGFSQADFKNLLLEGFMTREEWARWWADNRKTVRRDPYVDWERGVRGVMRLRSEPKPYYAGVAEEFRENDTTAARVQLIAEVAKHVGEEPPPEAFARELLDALPTEFDGLEESDLAGRLEKLYLARDLTRVFPAIAVPAQFDEAAILSKSDNSAQLILALTTFDFQCRAMKALTAINPARAAEVGAQMLPDAGPRFAQWLIDRLIALGEIAAVSRALDRLLRSPARNPEMFLWAARNYFADKYVALTLDVTPHEIISEMAEFVRDCQNQVDHGVPNTSTLRGIIVKMKNFLGEDRYTIVRRAVTPLTVAEARTLCKGFDSHAAFPELFVAALRHAVMEIHPDFDESAKAAAADLDEEVLYVTTESLQRKQGELQHLRSVEIPKNSHEIGEAASLGDLSENAEYEAAHHRQRILFKRAEELQKEIERARPIDPGWVRTDRVWPGTRFQARDVRTGEIVTYAILGAWDGRPEENVLSYLTPAAQKFLRRRVGEKVLAHRPNAEPVEYEILSIENALAPNGGTQ